MTVVSATEFLNTYVSPPLVSNGWLRRGLWFHRRQENGWVSVGFQTRRDSSGLQLTANLGLALDALLAAQGVDTTRPPARRDFHWESRIEGFIHMSAFIPPWWRIDSLATTTDIERLAREIIGAIADVTPRLAALAEPAAFVDFLADTAHDVGLSDDQLEAWYLLLRSLDRPADPAELRRTSDLGRSRRLARGMTLANAIAEAAAQQGHRVDIIHPTAGSVSASKPEHNLAHSDDLHALVKSDPERAWLRVLAFVRDHPDSAAAQDLIEDLIYEHNDVFIERIEAAAREEPLVRSVVEQAYVGGFATAGAERFRRLQERLRQGSDDRG